MGGARHLIRPSWRNKSSRPHRSQKLGHLQNHLFNVDSQFPSAPSLPSERKPFKLASILFVPLPFTSRTALLVLPVIQAIKEKWQQLLADVHFSPLFVFI